MELKVSAIYHVIISISRELGSVAASVGPHSTEFTSTLRRESSVSNGSAIAHRIYLSFAAYSI